MQLRLKGQSLGGELTVPASKSYSHRALICAALADSPSQLTNIVLSDDVLATLKVLEAFGLHYQLKRDRLEIYPSALKLPEQMIDCGASGSSLRFLLPLAFYLGEVTYTGRDKLVERPLTAYLELMQRQNIDYQYAGKLPIKIKGGSGLGEKVSVDLSQSSQFLSGLLLTAPLNPKGLTITVEGEIISRPYIDLTIDVIKKFAVEVQRRHSDYKVAAGSQYRGINYQIEADYSTAANWLVAGVLGSGVRLSGLVADSLQADRKIIDILTAMGAKLEWQAGNLIAYPSATKAATIDAGNCPDLVPILAVLAAFSQGKTRIYNAPHLKYKESDRIAAIADGLSRFGASVVCLDDGLIIDGGAPLSPARVKAYADHRIAMALAIAASRIKGEVIIEGADSVNKSYPDFWRDYQLLGGKIE